MHIDEQHNDIYHNILMITISNRYCILLKKKRVKLLVNCTYGNMTVKGWSMSVIGLTTYSTLVLKKPKQCTIMELELLKTHT